MVRAQAGVAQVAQVRVPALAGLAEVVHALALADLAVERALVLAVPAEVARAQAGLA